MSRDSVASLGRSLPASVTVLQKSFNVFFRWMSAVCAFSFISVGRRCDNQIKHVVWVFSQHMTAITVFDFCRYLSHRNSVWTVFNFSQVGINIQKNRKPMVSFRFCNFRRIIFSAMRSCWHRRHFCRAVARCAEAGCIWPCGRCGSRNRS